MNANQAGRQPRCHPGNEMPNEALLLRLADAALSHRPLDTPKSGYPGQPLKNVFLILDRIFTVFHNFHNLESYGTPKSYDGRTQRIQNKKRAKGIKLENTGNINNNYYRLLYNR